MVSDYQSAVRYLPANARIGIANKDIAFVCPAEGEKLCFEFHISKNMAV